VKRARRNRIMRLQKRLVVERRRQQVGQVVPVLVDGPSPESPLVVIGRLEGQAPDIDSRVVFSDCDPSALRPGEVVSARILAARGYDLVATPLPAHG
jgi:ribosomal protein S12 methylthiotransferase